MNNLTDWLIFACAAQNLWFLMLHMQAKPREAPSQNVVFSVNDLIIIDFGIDDILYMENYWSYYALVLITTPSVPNYKSLWLFWLIHFAMYLDILLYLDA